ncbi:unnamed protein product [Blepharisma stoltei]|uniref:Uncharacterized protein n=1 Tax=Blepharisma stoltei TaxID=1481888 RepID=A0AAU9J600_9CILI|nr:unnamed protein product [Blepharisma stoltei]
MGVCNEGQMSVSVDFTLDSRFFQTTNLRLRVRRDYPMKSICEDLKSFLPLSYTVENYKVLVKFRGKVYGHKDHVTLADLNSANSEKMTALVVPKNKDKISITLSVHCCSDSSTCIQLPKNFTVDCLKTEILKAKSCCARSDCRIIINDTEVTMDDSFPYSKKSQIHIIFQSETHGSCTPSSWKIKKTGLTKEGLCMNPSCAAYKQVVYISKGLGTFDLLMESSSLKEEKCIMCETNLYNTQRFGFINCIYSYIAEDDNKDVLEEEKEAGLEYSQLSLMKVGTWTRFEVKVDKYCN